jgi:hypothetical protein
MPHTPIAWSCHLRKRFVSAKRLNRDRQSVLFAKLLDAFMEVFIMSIAIRVLRHAPAILALTVLSTAALGGCQNSNPEALTLLPVDYEVPKGKAPIIAVQPVADGPVPDEIRDVDLGKVMDGTELRHTFTIRNTTTNPLKVISIKKSCGCETADVTEGTVIGPGDKLEVAYALSKYGAGERKGQLLITTDAEEESLRVIELKLRAYIQPKVWTTPSDIKLVTGDESTAEQKLRIETIVPGLLDSFKGATTTRGNVAVRLKEDAADALTLGVTVAPNAPWGTSYDLLYLAFDSREQPSLNVRVQIRKGHPLAIIPATLKLPTFEASQTHVRKVRILSPTGTAEAFRITKVECPAGIAVGELPSEARHTCDVSLAFSCPVTKPGDKHVIFHTEPPGAVTLAVRYSGPVAQIERSIP